MWQALRELVLLEGLPLQVFPLQRAAGLLNRNSLMFVDDI